MQAFAKASFVAGASLSLWGCGGGSTTTPAPAPGAGKTVLQAWTNHINTFVAFDVPGIMKDYDENSQISTYNDHCFGSDAAAPVGLKTYKGLSAIEGFFTALFSQLGSIDNVNTIGPLLAGEGAPVVKEGTGGPYNGNVFLTWRTNESALAKPIKFATDTFMFRLDSSNNHVIDLQTIVTTEESTACAASPGQLPTSGSEPIFAAWDNHLAAFSSKNENLIMDDYTEASIVQVFDNTKKTYEEHKGLGPIKTMFVNLFAAIEAGRTNSSDPGTEGIAIGLLEIDPKFNSVFLAWKANSHPKATDTFTFYTDTDGKAKISRQNIVVSTPASEVQEQEEQVIV